MIYIFKIISGEEYIGKLDAAPYNNMEYYNITLPMAVVDGIDEYGGVTMKLRDAMLLSDDNILTIPNKMMIAYYPASKIMVEYYGKAVLYAKEYTKKKVEKQIKEATSMLNDAMAETAMDRILRELRIKSTTGTDTIN